MTKVLKVKTVLFPKHDNFGDDLKAFFDNSVIIEIENYLKENNKNKLKICVSIK